MKATIERLVRAALAALPAELLPEDARGQAPEIERTREASHGDYSSNAAMRHAKAARQKPRALAEAIVAAFTLRLRDAVDLETVRGELLRAVNGAVQPAHVSVWIRPSR